MSQPDQYQPDGRRLGRVARDLLDRVGDRWSALVIYVLYERPLRFSELKTRIDEFGPKRLGRTEISHKMLAEVLRELRRDGLIIQQSCLDAVRACRQFKKQKAIICGRTA